MIKLFLGNRAVVILLLPFFIGAYFFCNYFTHYYSFAGSVYLGFFGELTINTLLLSILCFVLVFCNAFLINYTFNSHDFYTRNTYLPSFLYVVSMSLFPTFYTMGGLLLTHTFLLLMLMQFFQLRQNKDGRRHVFNAAFFAGLATLIHPPMLIILPFLFSITWAIRPFVLHESTLVLVGFGVPIIYGCAFLFFTHGNIIIELLHQVSSQPFSAISFYATVSVLIVLSFIAFLGLQKTLKTSSIRFKKLTRILFILFLFCFIVGLLSFLSFDQLERFNFLLLPLLFLVPFAFLEKKLSRLSVFFANAIVLFSFLKFFL